MVSSKSIMNRRNRETAVIDQDYCTRRFVLLLSTPYSLLLTPYSIPDTTGYGFRLVRVMDERSGCGTRTIPLDSLRFRRKIHRDFTPDSHEIQTESRKIFLPGILIEYR